jgi:predicted nucleic-acid-binding Zn-ribbon protein
MFLSVQPLEALLRFPALCMETKTCPKCGSTMQSEKHLQALGSEIELVSKSAFMGDRVKVHCCEKCGFIELYREKKE